MQKAGRMGIMAVFLVMMAIAAPALPSFVVYSVSNQIFVIALAGLRLLMMYVLAVAAESLFFDFHTRLLNEIKPKSIFCFRRAGIFWRCISFLVLVLSFGVSFLGHLISIAVFIVTFALMYFPTRGAYLYFTENEAYFLRDYSLAYTKITAYSDDGGELILYFNLGRKHSLEMMPENEYTLDDAIHELSVRGVRKY